MAASNSVSGIGPPCTIDPPVEPCKVIDLILSCLSDAGQHYSGFSSADLQRFGTVKYTFSFDERKLFNEAFMSLRVAPAVRSRLGSNVAKISNELSRGAQDNHQLAFLKELEIRRINAPGRVAAFRPAFPRRA